MKGIIATVLFLAVFAINASAYIDGWNISPAELQSATDPNHHGMATFGVNGSVFWIDIPQGQYYAKSQEQLSGNMRLIIDGPDTIAKRAWIAMIMQAKANGTTIAFSAVNLGGNNMRVYYLVLK